MKKYFSILAAIAVILVSCDKADTSAIEARLDTVEKVTLASLQGQIAQINTTLGTLQATQTQLSGFVTALQTSVGTLEGNYSGLVSAVDNLGKQDEKFEKDINALEKAIGDSEKDLKKWVEESYVTLTLFNGIQEEVSTIKTNIQTIFSRLEGLDENTKQIAEDLEGLSSELNERLEKCENDIESIKKDLKGLQDDMDSIKAQIAAIVSAVQSIVVVPDYSDGSVKLSKVADNKVRFEVYPLKAAEAIANAGPSILSFDYVETLTKSSEEFVNLPITGVSFTGKTLLLTVDGTGLDETIIEGTETASARLKISDGTIVRSSEYFPIYRETGAGSGNSIAITGDAEDISETSATIYGWCNLTGEEGDSAVYGFELSAKELTKDPLEFIIDEKDENNRYFISLRGRFFPNSRYYYRAFTIYNGIRVYGEVKSFKTLEVSATVTTLQASDISDYKAILHGSLSVDSKDELSKSVFFLCSDSATTIEELKSEGLSTEVISAEEGPFQILVSYRDNYKWLINGAMKPNTTYYYAACAHVAGYEIYGEVKSFKTLPLQEVVDLGLSVKWRSCNIGASKPEEYGDYYAWGETETKSDYYWETYKFFIEDTYDIKFSKYNQNQNRGPVDNKVLLDPEDDVAHVKLGGNWRMPTEEEWLELLGGTNNVRTTLNGVPGRLFYASNGNHIFIPAAGCQMAGEAVNCGSEGVYWSSELSINESLYARNYHFRNDDDYYYYDPIEDRQRYYGCSVRPVTE